MTANNSKEAGYEGFVSSAKAINLSIVSVCVWGFTFMFYKMAVVIVKDVDYAAFCLFCSFILSLVLGVFISRKIYSKKDNLRFLAILLNIFLIYTSANGIQAGNAAFSKPENGEKKGDKMALFGIFDARPWLPDATSKNKIKDLTEENVYLTRLADDYKQALNSKDEGGLIKTLTDENVRLKMTTDSLTREIMTIREKSSAPDDQKLQAEINLLRTYINEKVYPYINTRNEWVNRANSDKEFADFANRISVRLPAYKFSQDYYNRLFYSDLTPPR
jgi:hypothetical protein